VEVVELVETREPTQQLLATAMSTSQLLVVVMVEIIMAKLVVVADLVVAEVTPAVLVPVQQIKEMLGVLLADQPQEKSLVVVVEKVEQVVAMELRAPVVLAQHRLYLMLVVLFQ
jgi:hypothetical protein